MRSVATGIWVRLMHKTRIDRDTTVECTLDGWQEALESVKRTSTTVKCKKGENEVKFYGASPGIVLERILFVRSGTKLPTSYLGPRESYIRLEDVSSGENQEEENE